jgi:hypothetical protein
MNRLARRIKLAHRSSAPHFDPAQRAVESAHRGRSGRAVRASLRQREPVALLTPRWSCPQAFLEDVALELAVSEPGIGCRTVNLRPLQGRNRVAAWQFLLRVLGQLASPRNQELHIPAVAEGKGFRLVAEEMLAKAQERSPNPVALLAHGAEHLPVEAAEDLLLAWEAYSSHYPADRRCVLLLGGTSNAPALRDFEGKPLELADFGHDEAGEMLGRMVGPQLSPRMGRAAGFTGGVPALVEALGRHTRLQQRIDNDEWAMLSSMGKVGDEIRGVVDILVSDHHLAARLDMLLPGEPIPAEPELDAQLITAGLARRATELAGDHVCIRAPAIAALVG